MQINWLVLRHGLPPFSWQRATPVTGVWFAGRTWGVNGMPNRLKYCIISKKVKVKVAGGVLWHFSHLGFLYPDPFIHLYRRCTSNDGSASASEGRMNGNFACDPVIHINRKILLHAAKLGHGTDSFTAPPKEGMLRIFNTR
jgi:hypothetical protein